MEITTELKQKIADIAKKHGLLCLVLFGSQATGKTHNLSDTDIAFMGGHEINYREQFEIQSDLEEIITNNPIELVNMRRISPLLMRRIADMGKLLYEDRPGRFIAFKIMAFKLYVETAPLRRLRERYLSNFIKTYAY